MKKLFLFFIAAGASLMVHAQSKQYFRADGGIGAAMTFGELKSYGISAAVEPKFFFTPQIAAGLRLEGAALFGGKIEGSTSFDVGESARAAFLGKGEYYFSDSPKRFYVGIMAGRYTQANIGASSSGSASITEGSYFGYAPEVGVALKNTRISAIYNIVPGTDLVSVSSGSPVEVGRNYFVLQLGFKVFQIDL